MSIAISLWALTGCTKIDEDIEMPYITFGVSSVGQSTRGLITNENISNNSVFVYGVKDNTTTIFNNDIITKKEGNNWNIQTPLQWENNKSYSFYGYTYSGPSNKINITNSALKIEVSQPKPDKNTEYALVENELVDYMLSHAYKVANGSNNHIVMLYMQHAMACMEVIVKKQMSSHAITLDSLILQNIFTSAIMECESQAIANSGNNNIWKIQLQGTNDVRYRKNFSGTGSENTLGTMTLLAVPQQLTSSTELKVHYSVDEDPVSSTNELTRYTQTFNLFNYVPYVWESGHKITYTLTINTGVELNAQVADWIDAGYTEGVILPGKASN